MVYGMKYRIESQSIEYQKIIIENETDLECLCRVDVNHRLFKIIYLESWSTVELLYKEGKIENLSISELI